MINFHLLLDTMEACFTNLQPFVVYSMPDSDEITLMSMAKETNSAFNCFDEPGFVFAPFDQEETTFCIARANSTLVRALIERQDVSLPAVQLSVINSEKERYKKLVTDALNTIDSQAMKKIVVSRKKEVELKKCDTKKLLTTILNAYPTAFRYIWFHPKTGLWCGASPELLLKTKGVELSTTSLAGTQNYNPNKKAIWTEKEKNEQNLVTKALFKRLEKFAVIIKPSATYTYKAGSLVHIRTDIKSILKKNKADHKELTKALHPTPAVCGTPREQAKHFIVQNEGYRRKFYTGFLGVLDAFENTSEFYVNLRCMQIVDQKAFIYVGGGITANSEPEAEWEETQNKLQTMLQVLHPFL